jgi:hypothetical protein
MSFRTIIKNKQNRMLSKTWRSELSKREIERNNYHMNGDLRKAREFAYAISTFKMQPTSSDMTTIGEPTVIFSRQLHV